MDISDWLFQSFHKLGLKHVFLVPGGEIDPLVIALGKTMTPKPIVACHEEGAGFMADGYARTSIEGYGVSLTIGAPGAGNGIPAALAASSDRSSVLFITGGSSTKFYDLATFQESDASGTADTALFRPTVRFTKTIKSAGAVSKTLQDALNYMGTTLPGPTHVSLPTNIQTTEVNQIDDLQPPLKNSFVDFEKAKSVAKDVLSKNSKVVALVGRGAVLSRSRQSLLSFFEAFQIPFATTFSAKGYLPEDHPLALGMFGYAGSQRATRSLIEEKGEVVLVLGSSLNQRDTYFWDKAFGQGKTLIQVDCNSTMIGRNYPISDSIIADIDSLLAYWLSEKDQLLLGLTETTEQRKNWNLSVLQKIPYYYDTENLQSKQTPIHPARIIYGMNNFLPDDTLLFIDSGAHRAFAGHYWYCKGQRSVCSATRLGPMGWAIPASIGGKVANPNRAVVTITGDGCMRMHGIEIATAAKHKLPVIFIVSNNSALGNVYLRMVQANEGAAELTSLSTVDWVKFGQSLGADGVRVENPNDLESAFKKGLASSVPFVIDVITDPNAKTPIAPYTDAKKLFLHDTM